MFESLRPDHYNTTRTPSTSQVVGVLVVYLIVLVGTYRDDFKSLL